MADPETLGEKLQRLRLAAGYSQSQMAKASKVPVGTLRNWEQDRRVPGFDVACRLAKVLGVSLDVLALEPEEPAAESTDLPLPVAPHDPSDDAAVNRLGLEGALREAFIQGRREMRAEMVRQAQMVEDVAAVAAIATEAKRAAKSNGVLSPRRKGKGK